MLSRMLNNRTLVLISSLLSAGFAYANNSSGTILFPLEGETKPGNLLLVVSQATDPEGVQRVDMRFAGSSSIINICNNNCNTALRRPVVGISPLDFGQQRGELQLELIVTDVAGTEQVVDTVNFDWQPPAVANVEATRQPGTIDVTWSSVANATRYNVYIASEEGITPANIESKADFQVFRSISATSQQVIGFPDDQGTFVLVTAVDRSGESAFSDELRVPILNNEPPVAEDDAFETNEDNNIQANVLDNDVDPEEDVLTVSLLTSTTNGTLTLAQDGTFNYAPNADFNGTDSFSYEVLDIANGADQALVTISVQPVNDAPQANNEQFQLAEDTVLTISAAEGLLNNDSDIDGDPLTASLLSTANSGTVSLNQDGSFSYQPNANFFGNDSFTYQAVDSSNATATATVSLSVTSVNDSPQANDDSYQTLEDQALSGASVLANDVDADGIQDLTVTLLTSVANGTLNLSANGTFSYQPVQEFSGSDGFTYQITDSAGETSQAAVTILVTNVNDAPVAGDDSYSLQEDQTLNVSAQNGVLANDSDPDSDLSSLTVSISSSPSLGALSLASDGSFSYTPNENVFGTDAFVYTVTDDQGASATATVTLSIEQTADQPIAENDEASTALNQAVTVDVLANDTDPDGGSLTVTAVSTADGSVTTNGSTVTYTPDDNFFGVATVDYTISNSDQLTASAQISISVATGIAIVANDDQLLTNEDEPATINVLSNDDGTGVVAVTSASAGQGSVTIGQNGELTYTPFNNFNGSDTINYSISDSTNSTDSAQVSVTVNAVNDEPNANDDSASTEINTSVLINALANDSDDDGDALTISSASVDNGSVAIQNQQLNYTPDSGFSGQATIDYTVSDGNGGNDSANVTVTVSSSQLIANNDTATTSEDTSINIDVLANDSGDSGLTISGATVSTGSVTPENDGTITYTPPADFYGTTTFTYSIEDDSEDSASATVTVTVTAVNDAPRGDLDVYTLTDTQSVTIPATEGVLINDLDIESDSFTASLLSGPAHASSFLLNTDGSFTYLHDGSDNVVDGFIYRPTDTVSGDPITVVLNIAKVNAPATMCNIPPLTATSGQTFSFDLEANNPDNDSLTYGATGLPSWLTLSGNTLSGTPSDSDIGVINDIELAVTDGLDIHPLSNIQLTVVNDFGSSDIVDFGFDSSAPDESRVSDMAIDRYGKIIAVGSVNNSGNVIAIARFNPDGTLDTSFSGDGLYTLDLDYSFDEHATGVLVDKNNNIFVSAYGSEDSSNIDNDFYLLKLKSDGTPDTSFSGDGRVEIEIQSDKADQATDLVLHSDGDITLVGHSQTDSGNFDIAMAHINPDGSIDTSFGNSGILIFNQTNDQFAKAALLDSKGHIYITGSHDNSTDSDMLLLRTTESGMDSTFNNGAGTAYSLAEANDQFANDIIFDNKGNLLVAGTNNDDFAIYSFELDANEVPMLNTSAFVSGQSIHDIGDVDVVHKLISDQQGAFYAVGIRGTSTPQTTVIKLNEDGTLDTSFATSGIFTEATGNGNGGNHAGAVLTAAGQLVTAGPQGTDTRLRHYLINDNTDFSCNYTGINTNAVQTVDQLVSATTASNYQMFFAGQSLNPADSQTDFVAFKTSAFNTPDIDFAENGILRHDSGSTTKSLTLTHVLADSNNSPYLVGYAGTDDLYIAKYSNDGQLDDNFGDGGVNDYGGGDVSLITTTALLDTSDNLYLMGTNSSNRATVIKVTPTGGVDLSFANGSDIEYGDTDFTAKDMAILSDGSIYLVGNYSSVSAEAVVNNKSVSQSAQANAVGTDLAIVKYTSLGQLDTSFGSGGIVQFSEGYNTSGISVTTKGSYLYILTEKDIGEVQLRKISSSGSLVSSFGTSGVLDLTNYQTYAGADIQYQNSTGTLIVQVQNTSSENVLINLSASNGDFNPLFINAGVATYTHNLINWEEVNGIIQADSGRFVIFGTEGDDMAMSVMEFDGSIVNEQSEILIDAGFGYTANAIALDTQSKILIAGSRYNTSNYSQDFTYAKFNFDGSADTGLTGSSAIQVTADAGGNEESYRSILVMPTSEVQVTGQSYSSGSPEDNNIVGLRTQIDSITADSNYAGGGFDIDLFSISDDKINDQILLSDGSVIMAGSINGKAMLLKLKQDGTLDPAFDSDGFRDLNLGDSSTLHGLTLDAEGKIVAVGEMSSSGSNAAIMIRVDATSGVSDTNFDGDGLVALDLSTYDNFNDVAITPLGNYVAVGTSDDQTFIAQYQSDGTLYTTFNGTGYITNDLGDNDIASAVMIDNFGAILVATQTSESVILLRYDDTGSDILLTEYYPQGSFTKVNDLTMDHQGNAYITGQMQVEQLWEFFVIKFNAVASPF